MKKPTPKEIVDYVNTYSWHKIRLPDYVLSSGTFSIETRFKNRARGIADMINSKFGPWVDASANLGCGPGVLVGYRSKELSKCEYCGWLDGMHSEWCHRTK
jgi:hypothetical protein